MISLSKLFQWPRPAFHDISAKADVRAGFWKNAAFVDFYFWVVGFSCLMFLLFFFRSLNGKCLEDCPGNYPTLARPTDVFSRLSHLAHRKNRSDFGDLRLRCPSRTPEIARFPRQEKAILHCDLRVRWKVASDLRFRPAISEPKTPSFCGISGDLAPSTRKSLAIVIVRFWCAKLSHVWWSTTVFKIIARLKRVFWKNLGSTIVPTPENSLSELFPAIWQFGTGQFPRWTPSEKMIIHCRFPPGAWERQNHRLPGRNSVRIILVVCDLLVAGELWENSFGQCYWWEWYSFNCQGAFKSTFMPVTPPLSSQNHQIAVKYVTPEIEGTEILRLSAIAIAMSTALAMGLENPKEKGCDYVLWSAKAR